MAPKNILVTGANGYIGASLIYRLQSAGYRISALAGPGPEIALTPDMEVLKYGADDDARLARAVAASDTLVHLAGVKGYDQCAQGLQRVIDANILFLQRLLNLVQNSRLKIIFASTYWVYGHKAQLPYREDQPIMPSEPYGWSKALGEQLIRTSGLPYSIVRLANVFGYGRGSGYEEVTSLFLTKALRGETIILKNRGAHCIDLVSLDDVCEVLAQLVERGPANTVNVGSGVPTTIFQLAEHVNRLAWELVSQRAGIELDQREEDVIGIADRWVSIEKLQQCTGFVPTPLPAALEKFARDLLAAGTV